MRAHVNVCLVSVALLGLGAFASGVNSQGGGHLNPQVDLLAAKKPVLGLGLPNGRGATPPKTPLDLAKDAIAHPEGDFFFSGSMERGVDNALPTLVTLMDAIVEAGGIATTPYRHLLVPVNVKTPNISNAEQPADPARYVSNISRQLNAGVTTISFVEVDNAEELREGIAAMRFASKGGTRPEDVGNAPKYWGLSEAEYRRKADVWPLSPDGELIVWAIVETKEGLEHVREIAQVKGLGVLVPGAGTLGGVFSTTNAEGRRVRDDVAWEAAIQKVLAACKEFKIPCGYPVSENDIETRMQQGFSVAILQAFNDAAFRAVAKGRAFGGR